MKTLSLMRAALAVGALALLAACGSDDAVAPEPEGLATLRAAITSYVSLDAAKAAGYGSTLTECMSNGAVGAMGIHYGKLPAFDGSVDPANPEVVIYEPQPDGSRKFVGVEFAIPYAVLPKTSAPPKLFGVDFIPNDVFQLWTLHVWTERANPSGLFAEWNPAVHCPA